MQRTICRNVANQSTVAAPAALILLLSATLIVLSSVGAIGAEVLGEFQPSDLGFPKRPGGTNQITSAVFGRDLSFGFIQPIGWDAVHIRWSTPNRKNSFGDTIEPQEEYYMNFSAADVVRYYTIHHVSPGQTFVFKVQMVKKNFDSVPILGNIGKDSVGPWIQTSVQVPNPGGLIPGGLGDLFTPLPAPPPAPPAATRPPVPPNGLFATRQDKANIYLYWTGAQNTEWYVVERRLGVAPLVEAGATPWVAVSGKLMNGRGQFIAHYPSPSGGLKNIFRVVAYNSKGQAASAPVAERASTMARNANTAPSGAKSSPIGQKFEAPSGTKTSPRGQQVPAPSGSKFVPPTSKVYRPAPVQQSPPK